MFRRIRKQENKEKLKKKTKHLILEEQSNKQKVAPRRQQQHSEEVPIVESTPSQPLSTTPQQSSSPSSSQQTMFQTPVVTTFVKPSSRGPTIIPPSPTSTVTTASETTSRLENLPVENFLISFRENGSECISSAYLMQREVRQSTISSGTLSTSLPEDVFSIVDVQTTLLHEYLKKTNILGNDVGDAVLIDGILSIIRTLWHKQTHFRNILLSNGLEPCVAAANDFLRMIDRVDELIHSLSKKYPHLGWNDDTRDNRRFSNNKGFGSSTNINNGSEMWTATSILRKEAADLISLYGGDAVYSAQKASTFVLAAVQNSSIQHQLFSRDWEDRLVHNEVAVSMVRTFEGYLSDIHNYMEQDFLYHKLIVALVRSTVCFYLKCLINKADQVRIAGRNRKGGKLDFSFGGKGSSLSDHVGFMSASRAICRMTYDIEVLRDYFRCVVSNENEALSRVVSDELSVLAIILECMWLAVDQTGADSLEEFIVVVHKRTGADSEVTKQFLSDIWLLIAPADKHHVIDETVKMMQSELQMVSSRMQESDAASAWKAKNNSSNNIASSLRLDEMLKTMYDDRNAQMQASICGNILRDVVDFRRGDSGGEAGKGMKNPIREMEKTLRSNFKNISF